MNGKLYIADGFSVDEKPLQENVFSCISIDGHSISKKFKASEVFYFQLDNKSVKSLIDGLYTTYGQLFACAVEGFKKNNGKKYKLILDNMKAGDRQFAEQFNTVIKEQLKAFMENDNAVYPQFKGTDLQTFDASSQNADDVIKLRKEIFDITAQALKIPLPMMYGNITNIQEIVKIFLTFCIDPLCDMISEEITRKINTYITWNGGKNFVRVDTSRINHIDILDVAGNADKLIASGINSVDELREVLDYQPLNTEFSAKHWITKNYTDVEQEAQIGGEER
jgi:HK97 family phage portal protein